MKCHNCSHDNPSDARFCQNCGQPLERVCPNCNTPNTSDAKFCKRCGTPLAISSDRLGALQQSAPPALQDKIRLASANIEGERKPVTILFTDIVGLTSLAEKLDPGEWKEIVSVRINVSARLSIATKAPLRSCSAMVCWLSLAHPSPRR
jgi:adenylate cyclase